jgi:hypothetical protein
VTTSATNCINTALKIFANTLTVFESLRQKSARLVLFAIAVFTTNGRITTYLKIIWISIKIALTGALRSASMRLAKSIRSALDVIANINTSFFAIELMTSEPIGTFGISVTTYGYWACCSRSAALFEIVWISSVCIFAITIRFMFNS